MGGRGASSGGGGGGGGIGASQNFQVLQEPPTIQPTQQAAQQANAATFADTDSRPYHDLRNGFNYYQSQNLTIDQQIATVNYLSDTTETGSLYSMSQNLNYNMANGLPLNANQQFVKDQMLSSMHNLGENVNLTRYDHSDFVDSMLKQKGINTSYDKMSIGQLQSALVGTKYGEERFVSTSTNNFKNAPYSTQQVFTSRAVKISYKAKANTQAMMPGNGPGGKLGEVVIAPSGGKKNYNIVGVNFTGNRARRPKSQSYSLPQIEIVVEVSGN